MARRHALLCALVLLAVGALPACSDGFPSRDEFIAKAGAAIPAEVSERLADARITPEVGNRLLEEHLGCIYDAIAADSELVDRITENPDGPELTEAVEMKAGECTEQANQAILEAVTASTQ